MNANYSIEAANVVHIANFPEFFKISAFFIAFVLLYLITVPVFMHFIGKSWKVIGGLVAVLRSKGYTSRMINFLSVLWIFWIIILPLAAVIVWGMVLAWSPSFSIQFGIGISLIGIFLQFIFLGFADWYGHNWHLTKLSIGFFIGATIAVFFYCFAVIFLPNYFSYNGTTAIFMAINFIFSTALTYLKTESFSSTNTKKERFIKLDLLVS
jgi:hypothetical protein